MFFLTLLSACGRGGNDQLMISPPQKWYLFLCPWVVRRQISLSLKNIQSRLVSQMLAVWTTYKRWLQSVESVKLCNVKTPMLFIFENCFAFSPVITGNVFYSSCLPPNTTHSWEFNGLTYTALSVSTDIGAVYDECRSITKRYINDMNVHSPPEVYSMKFYAMSYFWTRGSEVHLIGERLFVSLSS